jgi:uncharacterized protein YodC (DUF2158 family)
MNDHHFEEGDTVRRKSGGPAMTLVDMDLEQDSYRCTWREHDENRHHVFTHAEIEPMLASAPSESTSGMSWA